MADNTFMLEIVTPEEILYKEEVQFMVAPATEGEFGVLRNHAPLVAALKIGVLRYKDPVGDEYRIAISGGFVEVVDNVARVLAETAEHGQNIDILRAKASKERAERRLSQRDDNINYSRAKMSLQRSLARLKAAGEKVD
ncbi:MAG: F0F1 ATP synthase subunit epsilon [Syntrophomonadaceae bacterium]|jgi:F-type H+-transporting ATPase subunit epsilon|nr:F0F1 ATP synthase subunit epsilon [Syntrophomonadaceae bacterium]